MAPLPSRLATAPEARFVLPVVLVRDVGDLRAPNVVPSRESGGRNDRNDIRVQPHEVTFHTSGR